MNICVRIPPSYKGDIYFFTDDFVAWLEKELGSRAEESEAFAKKFGRDWTLNFAWDKGMRIKTPRLDGPWPDRKYKEMGWGIEVPGFKYALPNPKSYVPAVRQFLECVVAALTKEKVD